MDTTTTTVYIRRAVKVRVRRQHKLASKPQGQASDLQYLHHTSLKRSITGFSKCEQHTTSTALIISFFCFRVGNNMSLYTFVARGVSRLPLSCKFWVANSTPFTAPQVRTFASKKVCISLVRKSGLCCVLFAFSNLIVCAAQEFVEAY